MKTEYQQTKLVKLMLTLSFTVLALVPSFAQTNFMNSKDRAVVKYLSKDFPVGDLDHKSWIKAKTIKIDSYWSGEKAAKSKHFEADILWSDTALYVRFVTGRDEPLIVSDKPDLSAKTLKLWERDVCEIFLAPNREEFRKYYEFEIAPTGEWIDLWIHQMPNERVTDWDYVSGMKSAAKIEKDKVVMAFKIEWTAFKTVPKAGDIWLGNILRAMGREPDRDYLSWQPTMTAQPNFHVPEKFGEFVFEK